MIIRTYMFEKFQVDNDLFEEFEKNISFKKMSKNIKKDLTQLKDKSERIVNRIKLISDISMVIYFLIYFSVISTFFIDSYILDIIELIATKIIGVVGTSALFLFAYFLSKIKDIQYQKLSVLTTKRITIYLNLNKSK